MPFIPSLSLLCVQTLLNTPPAYCITAVWTTEALLKALGSNHADEQLLDRLLERGVLGMQAIKDHTNELPLVKIWWPVPTPTPCTTVTSIQQSKTKVPQITANPTPTTPIATKRSMPLSPTPAIKRHRISNINKPFKSPLKKLASRSDVVLQTDKQNSAATITPTVDASITRTDISIGVTTPNKQIASERRFRSPLSSKMQDPERKRLIERKRQLEVDIEQMETNQRRRAMMTTFQRQNKDRSINESINKWRTVCQEVLERIRDRIDPQAFIAAQSHTRPFWEDTNSSTTPKHFNLTNNNNNNNEEEEEEEEKPSAVPEQFTYRSLLKILGITDLRLFHYNDEDDCFY